MNTETQRQNPYVGPRAIREGEPIFGRSREERQLFQMLVARRIALLHSPSGAGKTSLIQAGLIPRMRAEGFRVLPVARLNEQPPESPPSANGFNRYIYSLLLSLQERSEERPDGRLATLSLSEYLEPYIAAEAGPELMVLIIDQFEEVLTADPTDIEQKTTFFSEVGRALRNPNLWALFVIREDYLGALEPYTRAIPTRLANRFRLDLLGTVAAGEAIKKPAEGQGVQFADPAVEALVDDLCQIQVQQPDGQVVARSGPYVEPVQLQVVCRRLWQALSPDQTEITENDLKVVGNVDESLAAYYAERIEAIKADPEVGVRERNIRNWIHKNLYTKDDIRLPVLRGQDQTEGLDNRVIGLLVDAHLLRADERAGLTWYELAHDRLVKPVRADNAKWFNTHLSLLQRQAQRWHGEGGPEYLLLRGQALQEAEDWAKRHPDALSEEDQAFLDASRKEREREEVQQKHALASARAEEAEARLRAEKELAAESALRAKEAEAAATQLRRRRNLAYGLTAGALALMVVAIVLFLQSRQNEREANANATVATDLIYDYQTRVSRAGESRATATAAAELEATAAAAGFLVDNFDDPAPTAVAATAAAEAMESELAVAQANATLQAGSSSEDAAAATLEALAAGGTATAASVVAHTATADAAQYATSTAEAIRITATARAVVDAGQGELPSDQLLFVSDRGGSDVIYVMENPAQSEFSDVTSPSGYAWWPAWCDNSVVFEWGDDIWQPTRIEIALIGSGPRNAPQRLTSNRLPEGSAMNGSPSCSLNGRYLSFSSRSEGAAGNDFKIGRIDLEAEEPTFDLLGDGYSLGGHVGWSPDGSSVVFMHYDSDERSFDIYRMPWDDSANPVNLTQDLSGSCKYPSWSPAGEQIAFTCRSGDSGAWSLYVYDGSATNQVLSDLHLGSERYDERQTVRHAVTPTWSPDGEWIAFSSDMDGDWDIYAYSLETAEVINLTEEWSGSDEIHPWWSRR